MWSRVTDKGRIFVTRGGNRISAWHDIPYVASDKDKSLGIVQYVLEIPRASQEKMEINVESAPHHWIERDVDAKGNPRMLTYMNSGVQYNYGAIPQTYEDPSKCLVGDLKGDGDPLDIIELSDEPHPAHLVQATEMCGSVRRVAILGALGLIDEGEIDWKLIAAPPTDALIHAIQRTPALNAHDIDQFYPGALQNVQSWYEKYKTVDGKAENQYIEQGRLFDRLEALDIVQKGHADWISCRSGFS